MKHYTESEEIALQAADARKRYKAWMSKPFAGHDVRALREAAKGDADGAFTVPPSLGIMLVDALRRKSTVRLREQPFLLERVRRLPRPPSAGAWQPLAAWLRARVSRLGERSSP